MFVYLLFYENYKITGVVNCNSFDRYENLSTHIVHKMPSSYFVTGGYCYRLRLRRRRLKSRYRNIVEKSNRMKCSFFDALLQLISITISTEVSHCNCQLVQQNRTSVVCNLLQKWERENFRHASFCRRCFPFVRQLNRSNNETIKLNYVI